MDYYEWRIRTYSLVEIFPGVIKTMIGIQKVESIIRRILFFWHGTEWNLELEKFT